MKEAFEKIVERLEEPQFNIGCGACPIKEKCDEVQEAIDDEMTDLCAETMRVIAKEIVKEVAEEYNNGWIPCSERLPEERDWYLAVFEEVDTGFIGLPYIADYLMGEHTIYTTEDGWIIHNCTDREDVSSEYYYKNLRCVAWQPLPEPFKERD